MKYAVNIPSCGKKTVNIEIGEKDGKVIATRRALKRHMLRRPPAWAFSIEVINLLQEKRVDEVQVICEGKVYVCDMSKFLKSAINIDRGFGKQLAVPVRYWTRKSIAA